MRNNCLDGKKTFKSLLTNQHQENKDTANTFYTSVTSIRNYQAITGIKKVIPFLKQETSKAQGQDTIHTKALNTDGDTQPSCYNDLFAKIWEEELINHEEKPRTIRMELGHLVMLPNKIILVICDNYKGIMLLSVPGKGA